MALKRQTLESWIEEAITDPDKGEPCRQIALVHMRGQGGQQEIHVSQVGANAPVKGRTPRDLAALFQNKAQSYAQELPGVQTFNLMAFYGESQEPQAFHPMMIAESPERAGLGTESPNAEGLAQQSMRHAEVAIKLLCNQTAVLFTAAANTHEALLAQNKQLMDDNQELFAQMKLLAAEKVLNEHDLRMKEEAYARQTVMQSSLIKLAPLLINTFTGKEVFPQSSADTVLVEQIAETLSEEDLGKLAGLGLDPKLMGPLAARLEQYHVKKATENARVKQLAAQARVTAHEPEAQAAGEA